jgi:hypothetical protein
MGGNELGQLRKNFPVPAESQFQLVEPFLSRQALLAEVNPRRLGERGGDAGQRLSLPQLECRPQTPGCVVRAPLRRLRRASNLIPETGEVELPGRGGQPVTVGHAVDRIESLGSKRSAHRGHRGVHLSSGGRRCVAGPHGVDDLAHRNRLVGTQKQITEDGAALRAADVNHGPAHDRPDRTQ